MSADQLKQPVKMASMKGNMIIKRQNIVEGENNRQQISPEARNSLDTK